MSILGSGSVHVAQRYAKKPAKTATAANIVCQKCLQPGHWTYECKNAAVYQMRPSRTKQLKDPKRRQAFMDPNQLLPELQGSEKKKKKKAGSSKESSSSSDSSDEDDSSSSGSGNSSGSSSDSDSSSGSGSSSSSGSDSSSDDSSSDSGSSSSSSSSSSGSGSDSDGSSSDSSESEESDHRAQKRRKSMAGEEKAGKARGKEARQKREDVPPLAQAKHRERPGRYERSAMSSGHRSDGVRDHRRSRNDHHAHAVAAHDEKLGKRRQRSPAELPVRSISPDSPAADRWQMA